MFHLFKIIFFIYITAFFWFTFTMNKGWEIALNIQEDKIITYKEGVQKCKNIYKREDLVNQLFFTKDVCIRILDFKLDKKLSTNSLEDWAKQ
jgi:hypothetical protein